MAHETRMAQPVPPAASRPSSSQPGFHRLSPRARLARLRAAGLLTERDGALLLDGRGLSTGDADRMLENAVGVFGLPVGLAVYFRVNGRDHLVPMVVEEPSVVAAASVAARLARLGGGFEAVAGRPLAVGQVHLVGCDDPEQARRRVLAHAAEVRALADTACPSMARRGGGAVDLQVHLAGKVADGAGPPKRLLVVHLVVDTRDAMGAATVTGMAEAVAPRLEALTGGTALLRIVSNLEPAELTVARCRIPADRLATRELSGVEVARRIALASACAEADTSRAATHNKGVMNGVDALALATGNDWRALEAGAHAYAARSGRYAPLSRWWTDGAGDLAGELALPLSVGTAGGATRTLAAARLLRRLAGVETAAELRELMAAVGLAQNLGALRALVTDGIRRDFERLQRRGR